MKSRTRSRKPASIGSNHSSRRPTAISPSEPRTGNFVLLLVMAWSPPAHNAGSFGFQHPETTPPSIPTTLRTAPVDAKRTQRSDGVWGEPRKEECCGGRDARNRRRQYVRHRYARCRRSAGVEGHITSERNASEPERSH